MRHPITREGWFLATLLPGERVARIVAGSELADLTWHEARDLAELIVEADPQMAEHVWFLSTTEPWIGLDYVMPDGDEVGYHRRMIPVRGLSKWHV